MEKGHYSWCQLCVSKVRKLSKSLESLMRTYREWEFFRCSFNTAWWWMCYLENNSLPLSLHQWNLKRFKSDRNHCSPILFMVFAKIQIPFFKTQIPFLKTQINTFTRKVSLKIGSIVSFATWVLSTFAFDQEFVFVLVFVISIKQPFAELQNVCMKNGSAFQ